MLILKRVFKLLLRRDSLAFFRYIRHTSGHRLQCRD